MEIELSDDPMDCTKLEMSQIPICISFSKVGKKYIVDPTSEELLCMSSQLTIAIDKRGNFCEICKSGKGYLDQHGIIEILKVRYFLSLLFLREGNPNYHSSQNSKKISTILFDRIRLNVK